MTITLPPNKKRGEFNLAIGETKLRLRASFANIALFEQHTNQGIYTLANKLGENDIRLSDFVNIIYYFNEDKEGYTQEDIFELFEQNNAQEILLQLAEFLNILFGVDENTKAAPVKKRASVRK